MLKGEIVKRCEFFKLTNAEKRIWYHEKMFQGASLHNIGGYIILRAAVDYEILDKVINQIIKEHDAFRIGLLEADGVPYQYVKAYEYHALRLKKFSSNEEFEQWKNSFFIEAFDIYKDELYSFVLCKLSEVDYRIVLKMHHIIADGWSFQLIAKYMTNAYFLVKNRNVSAADTLGISYLTYLEKEEEYLSSEQMKRHRQYWLERFKDADKINFLQPSKGLEGKRKSYTLNSAETSKLRKFVADNKLLLQTVVLAAYYFYRSACIGEKDITVGIPVFNRSGRTEKSIIGMFTSTIAYRFCIDEKASISDCLMSMNRRLKDDLRNQKYPYNMLIEELKSLNNSLENMFDVSINYYNSDFSVSFNEWDSTVEECYCGCQFYDLQIVIKEWNNRGELTLFYDYKTDVYSEYRINELHSHLVNIMKYMVENSSGTVAEIPVFSASDTEKYLLKYNSAKSEYPTEKTIVELFEECVAQWPKRCAIEYNGIKLTYKELNEQADRLANYLHSEMKFENQIIGICTLHSIESITAILAVLKAGCTYLPLDAETPEERMRYIVENSGLVAILSNFPIDSEIGVLVINLEELKLGKYSCNKLGLIKPAEIAYIIYTSGTTGKPKGVMIKQSGLVNYILWAKKVYHVTLDDKFALYTSLAFDLTVTTVFTPIVSGAAIIVYRDDREKYVLYRIIEENRTSIIKLTPAHLKLLLDANISDSKLTRFIVGGEDLKQAVAEQIYIKFGERIHIYNEYGPTEAVVGCMIYEFDASRRFGTSVPIGRPADNVQLYLLNEAMKPVIPGEKGELYIAGDGVAKGYLNNKKLTEERFIYNPFGKGKMYKTGDIARFIDEDIMEYVCRSDEQVKVNGYRIELSEIEECIKDLDDIDEAVVEYMELPNGNSVLCAFYSGSENIDKKSIKNHIKNYLPDYMIPVYFTYVEKFKLTTNGKLDRRTFPEMDMSCCDYSQSIDEKRKNILIGIVKSILNLENVSINDNFYSIGGDSIKAIQMTSRLSEAGYKIKTKDILSADCLGEIAEHMKEGEKEIYNIEHCSGQIKNTPVYSWFIDNKFYNPDYYVQSVQCELDKSVTAENLASAFQKIIEVHDGLRVNYSEENGFFYEESYINESFKVSVIEGENVDTEAVVLAVKQSISLSDLPIKATLIKRKSEDTNLLAVVAHHAVVDGVTWQIIVDDLNTVLEQIAEHKDIRLAKEFTTLGQWNEVLEGYKAAAHLQFKYWKRQIRPYNMMTKWGIIPENDRVKNNISVQVKISRKITEKLFKMAEIAVMEHNFTVNDVLLTALTKALTDLYDKNEITVLLESHGRENSIVNCDLSRTAGWFMVMYPVRFEFSDISDCLKMLDEVRTVLKRVPDNGIGYGILKYMSGELNDTQKYVRFNYLGNVVGRHEESRIKKVIPDFCFNSDKENINTCLIDVNCIRLDDCITASFESSGLFMDKYKLEELASNFEADLNELINKYCNSNGERTFLSKFTAVSLSNSDFNDLFE
jgi:amino acid adenylation domain